MAERHERTLTQPAFMAAGNPQTGQGGNPNIAFRIPTPDARKRIGDRPFYLEEANT
jgi:hypothetical protein